jgi:uncharacterized surface protein with fasciclin (FAS1) repeats
MRIKKPLAAATAAAAALAGVALAAPAQAADKPASIVAALAASAGNNVHGKATDSNWRDFDILLALAGELELVDDLTGFTGTVFAPADASFRGLVADLTNTFPTSEAAVLATLTAIADGTISVPGVGELPGSAVLAEVVKYHVTARQIPNLTTPGNRTVDTITDLDTITNEDGVALSDGSFTIKRPFLGLVGLVDDDTTDLNPFWFGQTIHTADGGTIHVIAGVLRPLEFKALFAND